MCISVYAVVLGNSTVLESIFLQGFFKKKANTKKLRGLTPFPEVNKHLNKNVYFWVRSVRRRVLS